MVRWCIRDCAVDDPGVAQGVEGPDHDPEVADRNVGTFDEGSRGGHRRRYFSKCKDRAVRSFQGGMSVLVKSWYNNNKKIFVKKNRFNPN